MTLNNFILKLIRLKLGLRNDATIVMCVGDKDRMYPSSGINRKFTGRSGKAGRADGCGSAQGQ